MQLRQRDGGIDLFGECDETAPRVDLDDHRIVHYSLRFGAGSPSFEYRDGAHYRDKPLRSAVTVNSADSYNAACLAGLGIIQSPRYGMAEHLRRGALVEVLPAYTCAALPVSLVHAHGTTVPKRVRAVMAWLAEVVAPVLRVG